MNSISGADLRPYQNEASTTVRQLWEQGERSLLGVAGTGAGKTRIFLDILCQSPGRFLLLADTNALVDQIAARAGRYLDLGPVARLVAGKPLDEARDARTVVATVQSLGRLRAKDLHALGPVAVCILDECHNAVTWRVKRLLFNLDRVNPGLRLLGVTATGIRPDGRSLGIVFETLAFHHPVDWLIRHGWLVQPVGHVFAYGGANGISESILDYANAPDMVLTRWQRLASDRQTIGYTRTVKEAREMADRFRAAGVRATYVSGQLSLTRQRQIASDFATGALQAVFNANLWTQGVDFPATSCILGLRRFESQLLFIQSIGRGLRVHPGKDDCLVLMFHPAGLQSLIQVGDILAREPEPIKRGVVRSQAEPGQRREQPRRGVAQPMGIRAYIVDLLTRQGTGWSGFWARLFKEM